MIVKRKYYDSANVLLRTDILQVTYRFTQNFNSELVACVSPRSLRTEDFDAGVVSYITIEGDYSNYDTSGPPNNFSWVSRTLGNGQNIIIDMSDLPGISDSISGGFGFGYGPFGNVVFGG